MDDLKVLDGKRLLIVDDEGDILETLRSLLDMCRIDTAVNFEDAKRLLDRQDHDYDAAILDIMGVGGYNLLEITKEKGVPTLMLTAHALTPDDFVRSVRGGAKGYIPKEKMGDIATYVADLIRGSENNIEKHGSWFTRLRSFYERAFGSDWYTKKDEFWKEHEWLRYLDLP
ncbi:MAG: response regulator [Pseudomonadota bacterium]